MKKELKEKWKSRVITEERKDYAKCKRKVFRVLADPAGDKQEFMEAFKVFDDYKCNEVTVWFYKNREEVDQGLPYTIAMIERIGKHNTPVATIRPTVYGHGNH